MDIIKSFKIMIIAYLSHKYTMTKPDLSSEAIKTFVQDFDWNCKSTKLWNFKSSLKELNIFVSGMLTEISLQTHIGLQHAKNLF